MNIKINTKEEALKAISELQEYIKGQDEEWVKIDYSVIPQSLFEKYGVKPFEIMKRKMRKGGDVWNNINYFDAKKEAEKLGYRLPNVREQMMLLEHYSNTQKPDIHDTEFLGIEELSYDKKVYLEWIEFNDKIGFIRGANWNNGSGAGVFALHLDWGAGSTYGNVGFRCAR
jgi:hypothetical protein